MINSSYSWVFIHNYLRFMDSGISIFFNGKKWTAFVGNTHENHGGFTRKNAESRCCQVAVLVFAMGCRWAIVLCGIYRAWNIQWDPETWWKTKKKRYQGIWRTSSQEFFAGFRAFQGVGANLRSRISIWGSLGPKGNPILPGKLIRSNQGILFVV